MKNSLQLALAAFLTLACLFTPAKACNLSNLTLDSVSQVGSDYHVYLTLCIGAGRTGASFGADGPTNDFAFSIFGNPSLGTGTSTLTPTVTSTFLGTVYDGVVVGPGFGIGEVNNIYYYNVNSLSFTCISSTAACGNIHSDCKQFHFVFANVLPTSIRAVGIEGFPPFGGCYPNSDMEVVFTSCTLAANAGTDQTIASGNCANLSATPTAGTAPFTYLWSNGATTQNITVCPTATTYYSVVITDAVFCTAYDEVAVIVYNCGTFTANAGADRTVYYGYAPQACATLTATSSGGNSPITYAWSNGGNTASINVCPTVTTNYIVTATSVNGCVATDVVQVTVVDVRCGSGLNKVYVCKNGVTKCISQSQVPSHLSNGWVLGSCSAKSGVDVAESFMTVAPNPASDVVSLRFMLVSDENVTVVLMDAKGSVINTLFNGSAPALQDQFMEMNLSGIEPGLYFVSLTTESGQRMTQKLVVME